jgi:hypothetical protein
MGDFRVSQVRHIVDLSCSIHLLGVVSRADPDAFVLPPLIIMGYDSVDGGNEDHLVVVVGELLVDHGIRVYQIL